MKLSTPLKTSSMKKLILILFASVCLPCFAQSTSMFMPEGSSDLTFGLNAFDAPSAEGSNKRRILVLPSVSVQWSNGVFLDNNELGMNFSPQGNVKFGPVFIPEFSTVRTQQGANPPKDKLHFTPEVGAFYHYRLAHNIGLSTNVMFGAGSEHNGILANLSANFSTPLAAHHSIGLSTGLTLANQNYMQSQFGLTQQQVSHSHNAPYTAAGGLKSVSVNGNWGWELSNKYSLSSGVGLKRLCGSAVDSPLIDKRNDVFAYSSLSYHY